MPLYIHFEVLSFSQSSRGWSCFHHFSRSSLWHYQNSPTTTLTNIWNNFFH